MHIIQEGEFRYVSKGDGPVLLLLHGLFGALSNFQDVMEAFSDRYQVVIPLIPIYDKTHADPSVDGLTKFVEDFVEFKDMKDITLLGNSLGGHIGLVFALRNPALVKAMILTGSSGLFESGMGSGFPRRGSYEYVQDRVKYTFYDPEVATKDLVEEVFDIVNDNYKTLRTLKIARSAQRHNMRKDITRILAPTLLIWGLNDNITPPRVAHEFDRLIPNTELRFIDKCGHAAMMERPTEFNLLVKQFLAKHVPVAA